MTGHRPTRLVPPGEALLWLAEHVAACAEELTAEQLAQCFAAAAELLDVCELDRVGLAPGMTKKDENECENHPAQHTPTVFLVSSLCFFSENRILSFRQR